MTEEKHQEQLDDAVKNDAVADSSQDKMPEVSFINYVTSMVFQAMIFLGEIPNPITNEEDKNLQQARLLIDTIAMIKEKTSGNLNQQEAEFLNTTLYELQMKFVQRSQTEEIPNDK